MIGRWLRRNAREDFMTYSEWRDAGGDTHGDAWRDTSGDAHRVEPHHRRSPADEAFFLRRRKHIFRILRLAEDAAVYPKGVDISIWSEAGISAIGEMLAELLGEKSPAEAVSKDTQH